MSVLVIREATPEDASAIAGLVNSAFRVEAFFKKGDRTDADEIRDMMSRGRFLLLDEPMQGREPVLAACVYTTCAGERAYFGMLAVRPDSQGRGLGRRLIDAVEAVARDAGCHEMEIHIVNLREELPPFYRALGYVERGTLPFPEDGDATRPCHFIVMTKTLTR